MNTSTSSGTPEQLPLLSLDLSLPVVAGDTPLQFRLDLRTRQRGLAHIAAIKAQLTARAAQRAQHPANQPRRQAAA